MTERRLVVVDWVDTTNVAAWQTLAELAEWARAGGWRCRNVGWLVHEDDDCVVLAARIADDHEEHVGLAERIPRAAVVSMTDVTPPPP